MTRYTKAKLGDICRIEKGRTGIASAAPGEYPLVVTAEERKTCSEYQFDCEAVCIPLVSSSGHGKKSLKNVHYQSGKFALGSILCAVIPNNPQEVNARYLHQYLQFYKDTLLVPLMKGAANVSLSIRDIAKVEIPLPDFDTQAALAKTFVEAQKKQKQLDAEFEKQTEYAKQLRQNILQEAIEGKLTAEWRKTHPVIKDKPDFDAQVLFKQIQKEKEGKAFPCGRTSLRPTPSAGSNAARNARLDDEQPFEIPKSWKWVRLGQVSNINGGYSFKSENYSEIGIRIVRISDFNENGFVDKKIVRYPYSEKMKAYCLEKNNILMALTGGTVGKSFFVLDIPEIMVVNQRVATIKIQTIIPKYADVLLKSKMAQERIQDAKHSSNDNISLPDLIDMPFPLPPLAEQKEIVAKVESLLAEVTELEEQIQERKEYTDQLMKSILKDAFEEK